jgi:thiamine-phosphate pyrophosphorylase
MNMKIPETFGLYGILTDPVRGYEYTAQLFADFRLPFIQLRMKKEPEDVIRKTAEKLLTIIAGNGSKLIINDHPDIAGATGAAGVHLGQDDMPYENARRIAGPGAIIGISTHSVEQTRGACSLKPDYIGIGPVYATPTKNRPDPVIGIHGMKAMLAAATLPAVVIGGIDLSNLREVLSAGAKNFCMVRQLMLARNPEKPLIEALKIYRQYYPQ